MKRLAHYPAPSYSDPRDRRLVQIIRRAHGAHPGAVNILGVPFDGAVLGRRGASGGPSGIRGAMSGFSNYNVELGVGLEGARIYDLGDLVVDNEDAIKTHASIQREVARNLRGDSLLTVLGGDNSVSLPSIIACSRKFRRIGLIVVDSHFDLRGRIRGKPTSGSSYGLAMEELRSLDPRRVVEMGIHGFLNSRAYYSKAKRLGITILTAKEVLDRGPEVAAKRAYKRASEGAEAVYLSIDLDAVDMAQVSGVSAPSAGGIPAQALFDIVYELARRRKVVAADIVELAPNLDPTGKSERVAATTLAYLAAGFATRTGA